MAFVVTFGAHPAAAQTNSRNDPAQIERALEQELARQKQRNADPALGRPAAPAQGGDPTPLFVLRGVRITGGFLPDSRFAAAYGDRIGRKVSEQDLNAIAAAITAIYRDAGYLLTRALIPPQDVEDGVIAIDIAAGAIETVEIKGDAGAAIDFSAYVARLKSERPLTGTTFERQLLLMSDVSGVTVADTALEEIGEGTGRFLLIVHTGFDRFGGLAAINNRGSGGVGPLIAAGSGVASGVTRAGDAIQAIGSTVPDNPEELGFGKVIYTRPLGATGLSLTGSVSFGAVNPGGAEGAIGTYNESAAAAIGGEYAVIRSQKQNLRMSLVGEVRNFDEDNNAGAVARDRLRTVMGAVHYTLKDPFGGNIGFIGFGKAGLDILGASESGDAFLSRGDGDGEFLKGYALVWRSQPLGHGFEVVTQLAGQTASDPLLASEEFSLGGAQFGRAYDGGELTGDEGAAGSVELRFTHDPEIAILKFLQFYGFYDAGIARNIAGPDSSLSSAGGGVRLSLVDGLFATIELAVPLTRRAMENSNRDPKLFFNVSRKF